MRAPTIEGVMNVEEVTNDNDITGAASVLSDVLGLESSGMDISDRLHGYAMLHKGMTPESWAMAEGRDEIIGLRQIVAAQREYISALEQVGNLQIEVLAASARGVFDVAEIERLLKTLAAKKVECLPPNAEIEGRAAFRASRSNAELDRNAD